MRQGFRPATINVFAHSVARSSGSVHPLQNARARGGASSAVLPGIAAGRARSTSCEAGGAPVPVGVAGPGNRCPPGKSRRAAAEEDQWRPVPGHLTVDRGADDDQVITAVGLPDAEVPGPGECAEPGRGAPQAREGQWC